MTTTRIDIDRQTHMINELKKMSASTLEEKIAIDAAVNYYEIDINMQYWMYYTLPQSVDKIVQERLNEDKNDIFGGWGLTEEDVRKECAEDAEKCMRRKGLLESQRDYFKGLMEMYPEVKKKFNEIMDW